MNIIKELQNSLRDYDIDLLQNLVKQSCDNTHVKYIFLTGDKRLTEKLFISERSIAVTLSDTFSIETLVQIMLKGIYARDYYYIPLCDKKMNNSLINIFNNALSDVKFSKNAYTIFKGKSMDYFLQSENFDELQKNINKFLDKIEGKERFEEFDFNNPIFIENNCYTKQVIKNNALVTKKISNFIIIPIEQIMQDENNALIKIKLLKSNGVEIIRIYPTVSFYKATEFKKVLNATTTGLYFKGNDEDLEDVKALFNEIEYPIKQGVKITGLQLINNKWTFSGENRTFNAENETLSDYVYLNETEMRNNIDTVEPITADEFNLINVSLFQFNDVRKCMVILGFIGSCFIKEKLYKAGQKLNHLFLIGQAGSGKSTTLENIIMPFFGVDEALKTSANGITRFTLLKKSSISNTIPFFIDEFKPYEFKGNQKEWLSEILKNAYDRLPSSRGNIRQQINTYVPLTPIVLCGESGFNETAITERAIQLSFSKKQLNNYNKTALNELIKNKLLLTKLGRKLIDVALNISVEEVEQLHFKYYDLVEQSFDDFRVRKNVANILVGLEMFNKVYESFNMQPIQLDKELDMIVEVVKSDTLDDLNSSTSMVDETMQLIDTILAENITLTNMYQTDITEDGQELLYLNVTGIYNYLYKYIKDIGLPFKPLPEKDFKKQLKDSLYCLDHICQKKFKFYDTNKGKNENINLRCFKLDLKILNEKLNLKEFKINLPPEFEEDNRKVIDINTKKQL